MTSGLTIRGMTRAELGTLVDWAADEGWNPGLHDAELFWTADPEGHVAAELNGELIGGGSIVSYGGLFGFMGLFIVRPGFRGRGIGSELWQQRKRLLLERLRPGAAIGMDGVFEMQAWYAKGGFELAGRNIRYRAAAPAATGRAAPGAPAATADGLLPLGEIPFADVVAYDSTCFPAPRERFLRAWAAQPDSLALASQRDGSVAGYGVIRRCRAGAKIGPLFADDPGTATAIYEGLARSVPAGPIYLDVPEGNAAAVRLARERGMEQVFGTARMYLGGTPALAAERIYGVTSFELG